MAYPASTISYTTSGSREYNPQNVATEKAFRQRILKEKYVAKDDDVAKDIKRKIESNKKSLPKSSRRVNVKNTPEAIEKSVASRKNNKRATQAPKAPRTNGTFPAEEVIEEIVLLQRPTKKTNAAAEGGFSSVEAPPTVKRKRGPTKKALVKAAAEAAIGAEGGSSSAGAPPVVKRKRGPTKKALAKAAAEAEVEGGAESSGAEAPPPVKRKRGPTKKALTKAAVAAAEEAVPETSPPVKRKRGAGKKAPPPMKEEPVESVDEAAGAPSKRKQGSPVKMDILRGRLEKMSRNAQESGKQVSRARVVTAVRSAGGLDKHANIRTVMEWVDVQEEDLRDVVPRVLMELIGEMDPGRVHTFYKYVNTICPPDNNPLQGSPCPFWVSEYATARKYMVDIGAADAGAAAYLKAPWQKLLEITAAETPPNVMWMNLIRSGTLRSRLNEPVTWKGIDTLMTTLQGLNKGRKGKMGA